jgi:predicted GIY-YIG superfamily endonuclease
MTVYVLHIEPPFKHARHYIGYTPDKSAERRVNEHLSCSGKGSPLIRYAVQAGCTITVAHVYKGATRQVEAWLKARRDTRKWCPCCGVHKVSLPDPKNISAEFKAAKRQPAPAPRCEPVYDEEDGAIPF